jgi:hypothetical protein
VVLYASFTLNLLLYDEPEHVTFFLNQDGAQLLAKWMDVQVRDHDAAYGVIKVIHALSRGMADYKVREAVFDAGCAHAVANGMREHPTFTEENGVIQTGVKALHYFSFDQMPQQMKTRIVKEGIADAVLAAMAVCNLAVPGMKFLHYVLLDHPENMKAIGRRALCASAALVLANKGDIGFDLAWYISLSPGHLIRSARKHKLHGTLQDGFGQGGGFTALALCFEVYEKGLVTEREGMCVVLALGSVCMAVSDHPANQDRCGKEPIIPAILRVMAKHTDDTSVQALGCRALYAIGKRHEKNSEKIVQAGAIKYVMQAASYARDAGRDDVNGLETWSMANYCGDTESAQAQAQAGDAAARAVPKAKKLCVACGKLAAEMAGKKMLKCSGCTLEPHYCSTECQRLCWHAHKAECRANKKPSS